MNYEHPHFDFSDDTLFGAEAAEQEKSDEVFRSYFYQLPEFCDFVNKEKPFAIVNAYKGEGKSAMVRAAEDHISQRSDTLTVAAASFDLSNFDQGESYDGWVRMWRNALVSAVAAEIGKEIGFAWGEDDIRAVELAENNGLRERNLLGLIINRFEVKLKNPNIEIKNKVDSGQVTESVLKRMKLKKTVWLFVDDADANFINSTAGRFKVAGLLTAARRLSISVDNLIVRTTLKPTTWTVLYSYVEDMTHVREYLINLSWQAQDIRNILSKRIEAYLIRNGMQPFTRTADGRRLREVDMVALLFGEEWKWAKITAGDDGLRSPYVVLSNLCKDRPRWLIELCKESSDIAAQRQLERITKECVIDSLPAYGRRRIMNLVGEFSAECSQIETLLNGFSGQKESYKTDELLKVIKNRITNHTAVRIVGELGRSDALRVAHFLFKIGFLTARMDFDDERYEHYSYSQKPSLLRDRANPDQGCSWEIHPIFRQALNIRDPIQLPGRFSGKERK